MVTVIEQAARTIGDLSAQPTEFNDRFIARGAVARNRRELFAILYSQSCFRPSLDTPFKLPSTIIP